MLIRRCKICQRDLAIEPAIVGLQGTVLCFRCRFQLDEAGGERFLHDLKSYPDRAAAWQSEFGRKWIRTSWLVDGFLAIFGYFGIKAAQKLRLPARPQKPTKSGLASYSNPELLFDGNPDADLNIEYLHYKPRTRLDSPDPPDWKIRRRKCFERDGWRCKLCDNRTNIQPHHIIPRSRDGSHSLQNLITLCAKCHKAQKYYGHYQLIHR